MSCCSLHPHAHSAPSVTVRFYLRQAIRRRLTQRPILYHVFLKPTNGFPSSHVKTLSPRSASCVMIANLHTPDGRRHSDSFELIALRSQSLALLANSGWENARRGAGWRTPWR